MSIGSPATIGVSLPTRAVMIDDWTRLSNVENIYTLSPADGNAVWDLVQRVAVGIRTSYGCEGTSIRQHNEPAGDQDVWHLHVHVFPRYEEDSLYLRHTEAEWVSPDAREAYALKLRRSLGLPVSFDD